MRAEVHDDHSAQLSGFRLLLARGGCVTVFGLSAAVFMADLPGYFTRLQVVCSGSACTLWQLTGRGFSPPQAKSLQRRW
jgi:hypothetical protein